MNEKQKHLDEIDRHLGKWQDHLDDLDNMARDQQRPRQRQVEQHIQRVYDQLDELRRYRDQVVQATEAAGEAAKAEAERQHERVARTVDELTERLARGPGLEE